MKTIKNKNLILALALSIIFAFGAVAFAPTKVNAQLSPLGGGVNMDFYGGNGSNPNNGGNGGYNNNPVIHPAPAVNPSPIIYSLDPNSAWSGSDAMNVIVDGVNFIPSSIVKFNGSNRVTTYASPTRLIFYLNDSDMAGLGKYTVTVYNPAPGGGYSNGVYFTLVKKIANAPTTTVKKTATAKKTTVAPVAKTDTCGSAEDKNSLTASAIFGSDGFMPGNLMQWFLLAIMILIAVILWRKTVNKNKPLKQA